MSRTILRSARTSRLLKVLSTTSAMLAILLSAGALIGYDRLPLEIRYEVPDPFPTLGPDYRRGQQHVVLITDHALTPRLVEIDQGEAPAWISYSSGPSKIVFESAVAKSMV